MSVHDRIVVGSLLWAFVLVVPAASSAPRASGRLAAPGLAVVAGDGLDASTRADAARQRGTMPTTRDANVAVAWWASVDRWEIEARTRYLASIPASGFVAGRPAAQRVPSGVEIETLVRLLEPLTASAEPELASQALIALARTAAADRAALRERALARFGVGDREGARAAAIALCIADDAAARAALRWLVDVDPADASQRGRAPLASRDRAYAALALGAISDAADLDRLLALVGSKGADRDLRGLALLGVARSIERDAEARVRALPRLYALLDDGRDSRSIRSLVPAVLVRSGQPEAVLRVVGALRETSTIVEVRRAAAHALGEVVAHAPVDEAGSQVADAVVSQLLHSARQDRDGAVRQWATFALASWTPSAGVESPLATAVAEFHRRGVAGIDVDPVDVVGRSLAAGRFAGSSASAELGLRAGLRERMADAVDPAVRAAAARALALAGDATAVDGLRQRLGAEADPAVTAAILDAIASLGDVASRGSVERLCVIAVDPRVRAAAIRATALLAGPDTVDVLLRAFDAARDERERLTVARALGALGDARALAPLERIVLDPSRARGERAQAILALGLVVDPSAGSGLDALRAGVAAADAPDAVREWIAFERP